MFDFVTDPFESIRPQEGSSCPVSLMPTERDQVACRTKLHAETKFHSLVKAGEGQAGALDSTPSSQASGELLSRDLSREGMQALPIALQTKRGVQ